MVNHCHRHCQCRSPLLLPSLFAHYSHHIRLCQSTTTASHHHVHTSHQQGVPLTLCPTASRHARNGSAPSTQSLSHHWTHLPSYLSLDNLMVDWLFRMRFLTRC